MAFTTFRARLVVLPRVALLVVALVLSGCVAPGSTLDALSAGATVRVVDAEGAPVPYAAWALLARDTVVARGDAGPAGEFLIPAIAHDAITVSASGFAPATYGNAGDIPALTVELARASAPLAFEDPTPGLHLLGGHLFDPYVLGPEAACAYRNTCGLSEPVIENAPGDVVYASSTCCIGGSPPVWVSRDAGASWDTLDTPGVREAVGIEGDFAVDAAGNVYFTDILGGAMWLTSWDAQGNWRHTVPAPFEPLVDRPWVRAGGEDVVYFLYNTAVDGTNFHVSTDGGKTFLPAPTKKFPAGLGTIAQGPELDHLWVVAGMLLYESTDGGLTWSEGEEVPLPEGASDDAFSWGFAVPAVDTDGRVMVAYDLGTREDGFAIHAAVREPDGAWSVRTLTEKGTHIMPWPEAGPAGGFVVAWYGTDDDAADPDTVGEDAAWYAFLAATSDASASWQRARADAEPVLVGPMLRRLLDFLQVDLDERGAAHMVYAHLREAGNNERTSYVRTTLGLGLPQLPFGVTSHSEGAQATALSDLARSIAPSHPRHPSQPRGGAEDPLLDPLG